MPMGPGSGGNGYLPGAAPSGDVAATLANLARSLVFAILVGACAMTLTTRRRRLHLAA